MSAVCRSFPISVLQIYKDTTQFRFSAQSANAIGIVKRQVLVQTEGVTGLSIENGKQGLYLPFSIDAANATALGTLQKVKVTDGAVTQEPATSVEANIPYLLTTTADVTSINADNSEVKAGETAPTEGFIGGTGEAFTVPDNTYTWDAEAGEFVTATSGEEITVLLTSFYYVGEVTKTATVVELKMRGIVLLGLSNPETEDMFISGDEADTPAQ